jgi:uncharacterized protein YndB with AHSA1/START domain
MSTKVKSGVRAVADVEQGRILATVEIGATPERVFRALTTAELADWWGSPELYRVTKFTADLRLGGRWRSDGVGGDGSAFHVEGEYVEIEAPTKLVHTWAPSWEQGAPTTIAYRLEAIAGGTRVTVRHDGFTGRMESCRSHADGWERVFGWLQKHVAAPAEMPAFFCRLLPPRPTFMADMTVEERALMGEHAAYWKGMLEQGAAIIYGPVGGALGGWGLGVLRAPSEEALNALRDGDPVIQANRGFRYEVSPMLRAITKA